VTKHQETLLIDETTEHVDILVYRLGLKVATIN